MRIALAQINPTVGDLSGNRRLVEEAVAKAESERADVVVLPEMAITGYPPLDLLERDGFVRDQLRELELLEAASRRVAIVLGAVLPCEAAGPADLQNVAIVLADGARVAVQAKTLLPSYDVFHEKRHFVPAERSVPARLAGRIVGLTVCEDTWTAELGYERDPVGDLAAAGAALVFNPSCSPWHLGKAAERRAMLASLAKQHRVPIVFVNQVGGNDELIFDGASCALDAQGRVHGALPQFDDAFGVIDLPSAAPGDALDEIRDLPRIAELETGLVLGIRDYFRKQGLPPGAVVGLSGGVDSAVTAHLACRALGTDRVLGVAMPGPFSSQHSIEDALELGGRLGIEVRTVDIRPIYDAYLSIFAALFGAKPDYGIAQQNIQSRIRGAILMAVSNAENRLVLATGNKSELSVGYCTLYGDTVGGLAVIGDVYKHDVYALARRANESGERIPQRTIDKPPSAELAPDQLDSDDLPEYDVLDAILERAIEGRQGSDGITPPRGATQATVREVLARVDGAEYKRRQAPLVLRTSRKSFGSGRRLPIVQRYGK